MIPKAAYTSYQQLRKPGSAPREKQNSNVIYSSFGHEVTKTSSRPPSSKEKAEFDYDYDISQEFLDSLRSLTARDFEHATSSGENGAKRHSVGSRQSQRTPRKGNFNGYQFFHQQSSQATNSSRPSTVPGYVSRNTVGDGPNKFDGKSGSGSGAVYVRSRALTKSKVTPSQIPGGNESRHRSRTLSANSSDSSIFMSDSEQHRPSSASKRVTFAADTVNYERENKPARKRKMPKRRRQGFPHPSRGIFVPPDLEIVESTGPSGSCRDNPYLTFNQVWTHPAARATGESAAGKLVRTERFHRLMNDLEHAHIQYNRLATVNQNEFLTQCIFKRYILVLDLALTEGHIGQVEHLLDTISKSIPVLHQSVFYYLYGPKLNKESESNVDDANNNSDVKSGPDDKGYNPDLVVVSYALSKISGDHPRQEVGKMCLETILVKLCFELLEVVYSAYGSLNFRDSLTTLPHTVRQAIVLLKNLRSKRESFCYIKWINNSAVQRDFRSILKNLGLLDRYGCKADLPGIEILPASISTKIKKPSTASASNSTGGIIKKGIKGMGMGMGLLSAVGDKRGRVSTS